MSRRKSTVFLRGIGILLCIGLLSASSTAYLGVTAFAANEEESIAELQQKKEQLDKEIAAAQNKINANEQKLEQEENRQETLESQIATIEEQCTLYQQKIETVQQQIAYKELELSGKQTEIQLSEELFAARVHAMYIRQMSDSTLNTLVTASSFSDLLNRMEYLKRISEMDQQIISELNDQKQELLALKKQMEADQADLEETKTALDSQLSEATRLYSNSQALSNELLQANKKYMENKKKLAAEYAAADAEINRLVALLRTDSAIYGDGTFIWPLPGHTYRDGFGWRTLYGQQDYHPALDCPASTGTDILAAGDGKVLFVRSGPSYGNNLAIDHGIVNGKSIVTLYAHCNSIDVTEGQMVTKGQVIAHVGSTGNSTGPHLHLEFRVNDEKVNPLLYVVPN